MGVPPDNAEAERLYRAAAQLGHRSAQLALGSLKAETAASEVAWIEVGHWYRLAADAGHPAAMTALAGLYDRGRGVPLDRAVALALYRRALAAGEAAAAADVERLEGSVKSTEYAR
jgi:hypothetical protein